MYFSHHLQNRPESDIDEDIDNDKNNVEKDPLGTIKEDDEEEE